MHTEQFKQREVDSFNKKVISSISHKIYAPFLKNKDDMTIKICLHHIENSKEYATSRTNEILLKINIILQNHWQFFPSVERLIKQILNYDVIPLPPLIPFVFVFFPLYFEVIFFSDWSFS